MTLETDITEATSLHQRGLDRVWALIRRVQKDDSLSDAERASALSRLFSPLSYKDIKQSFVMDGIKHDVGVSYRSSMANMMRLKARLRGLGFAIAPGGNNKMHDVEFARRLGVPAPQTLSTGRRTSELELTPGTIIKPTQGASSKGVFLVRDDLSLTSVRSQREYETLEEATGELPAPAKSIRWITEEAILDSSGALAPDMKIYMFYGVPGMYVGIDRNSGPEGRPRYSVYNASRELIDLNSTNKSVEGPGIPGDAEAVARMLSINSPTPFLRIDLLAGGEQSYLGEITPHPGSTYAGDLFDEIDKRLGEYFLEAEARLMVDLLSGKTFDLYHSVYGSRPEGLAG